MFFMLGSLYLGVKKLYSEDIIIVNNILKNIIRYLFICMFRIYNLLCGLVLGFIFWFFYFLFISEKNNLFSFFFNKF